MADLPAAGSAPASAPASSTARPQRARHSPTLLSAPRLTLTPTPVQQNRSRQTSRTAARTSCGAGSLRRSTERFWAGYALVYVTQLDRARPGKTPQIEYKLRIHIATLKSGNLTKDSRHAYLVGSELYTAAVRVGAQALCAACRSEEAPTAMQEDLRTALRELLREALIRATDTLHPPRHRHHSRLRRASRHPRAPRLSRLDPRAHRLRPRSHSSLRRASHRAPRLARLDHRARRLRPRRHSSLRRASHRARRTARLDPRARRLRPRRHSSRHRASHHPRAPT